MPRVKKTRKVTQSIPPKKSQPVSEKSKRPKKTSGKAPGNRNSLQDKKPASGSQSGNKMGHDARIGSKKKVPLIVSERGKHKQAAQIPTFKSPVDELNFIERDPKLQSLMDKIDNDLSISQEEQNYVNKLLERHKLLCELLGINDDAEDAASQLKNEANEFDLLDELEKPFNRSL